jgi:hypothetical protein
MPMEWMNTKEQIIYQQRNEQSTLLNTPEDFIYRHVCEKRNVAKKLVEFWSQNMCIRMLPSVITHGGD